MIQFLEEIEQHFEKWYPKEGCGVLGVVKGSLKWFPCDNVAEGEEDFIVDSRQYISIAQRCDIVGIVHSHPDASPEPSKCDVDQCNTLKIPYYIFSYPGMELVKLDPVQEEKPLMGRDYQFGVTDCLEAGIDYYKSIGIQLPTRALFEDDWWDKGLDYFTDDYIKTWNFHKVEDGTMKENDLLIFKVMANVGNHCGVYLGDDIFYHHAVNRLSCRENVYPFWVKYISGVYRYGA